MKLKGLNTIGYEAAGLDDFLRTLQRARVTTLLDVRELAISRRKGFSKSALRAALDSVGIVYRHERALGAPRHIRHRLRRDGDFERYSADFREYLATQKSLVGELAAELTGRVALLCFERDPQQCHRSVVAAALAKRAGVDVRDLFVERQDAKQGSARADSRSRQSVSAT